MDDGKGNETKVENTVHHRKRLGVGIAALIVAVGGILVWNTWGEEIRETCFGEDGACHVEGIAPIAAPGTSTDLQEMPPGDVSDVPEAPRPPQEEERSEVEELDAVSSREPVQ